MKSPVATIEELRERGFHVKVRQLRRISGTYGEFQGYYSRHEVRQMQREGTSVEFYPRGGRTEVVITTPDEKSEVHGEARCRVDDPTRKTPGDAFNYRLGLRIALNRALKQLNQFNLTGHGSDGEGQFDEFDARITA